MRFYFENYQRYYDKGLDAYRAGDIDEARYNLLRAAEYLYKLATKSSGKLRNTRKQKASELVKIAQGLGERIFASSNVSEKKVKLPQADVEISEKAEKWIVTQKPNISFSDIAGLIDVKQSITRKVIYPFKHPEITAKYKKKAGGGVLLYGPPGTGKTMMAKAIANEIDATFFSVKCSDIMTKWVGEAEKNLSRLFSAARAFPRSVIFLDEVEAIVAKRGGDSTVMNRVIPEFLAQVDGFESSDCALLMLGATNRPWDIDEAALRAKRFGELIYVDLPDYEARLFMLRTNLDGVPTSVDINLESLAKKIKGFSGADIYGFCEQLKDLPYEREIRTGESDCIKNSDVEKVTITFKPSVSAKMLAKYKKYQLTGV